MTIATRTGTAIEAAIQSFRVNRRIELSDQTLDRIYLPRLNAFAAWVRQQGMPGEVSGLRREHVGMYIEHLQNTAPGRNGRVRSRPPCRSPTAHCAPSSIGW